MPAECFETVDRKGGREKGKGQNIALVIGPLHSDKDITNAL